MKLNTKMRMTVHSVDPNCSHRIAWLNSLAVVFVDSLHRHSASAIFAPNKPQTAPLEPTPMVFGLTITLKIDPAAALDR